MKIQFKEPLLAITFLFGCLSLYSQRNFKDGYVVLKSGDTLQGQIEYKNWQTGPSAIQFQKGTDIINYKPIDLSYFEITGLDSYVSRIVSKDVRPIDLYTLSSALYNTDSTVVDTAFLRVLVKGPGLCLYALTDQKSHYYIQRSGDTTMEELLYKKYLNNLGTMLTEQAIYRSQLAEIAGEPGSKEMRRQIAKSDYKEKDLIIVVRMINGESIAALKHSFVTKKTPLQVLIGGGGQYHSFKFAGDADKWTPFNFSDAIGPVANIALDIFSERNFQRLAVRLELSYTNFKASGTHQKRDFFSQPSQYHYKFSQNNLTPAIHLLYHFITTNNFRVYAGIGFGFSFSSYPVNEYRSKVIATGEEEVSYNDLDFEKFWAATKASLGVRIRDLVHIGLQTNLSGGFVNYTGLGTRIFPLSFTASYVIFKK